MRLKYLTLCVLGFSLSACSQHVIKTNAGAIHLEQKAINSLNAMYEYPSYDYRGKFNVHVDVDQKTATNSTGKQELDSTIKQKIDQYLRDQKVSLDVKQKQALYAALSTQQPMTAKGNKADQFTRIMTNVLNDLQFEYDGSVHYRQKMGSLNLTARYEKPTLLVQAKVPMVIDLKDYKFYVNYFALMPYLVNKENQNNLAYLDFSKYQNLFKQVDYKKFVEYVKASGAIYYRLAEPRELESLSVSSAEKNSGVVEKIRLKTSIEELLLEANLYGKVNEKYLMQSVLNLKDKNIEQLITNEVEAVGKNKTASTKAAENEADDASVVSQQLYKLVNQHFGVEDEPTSDAADEDVVQAAEATVDDAEDTTASAEESADKATEGLTVEQCSALSNSPKINYGDVQYCLSTYEVDVLNPTATVSPAALTEQTAALEKIFAAYNQNQFIDDQAFKALWLKHQAEIEKALPPVNQRNPVVIDVGLDAKGRAVKVDYDLNYALPQFKSRFNVKADMHILNYGQATPIDQDQLKRAKTWAEASKGSMLESIIGGFSKKLGTDIEERSAQPYTLSLDDQLKTIAEQRYDATQSYPLTYKAVFIAKLTETSPQIVARYSTQELQEIASVYAYWYSEEEVYNPKAKELKTLQALQLKHHLVDQTQFDNDLGQAVNRLVNDAMHSDKDRLAWKKLQSQYSQPQQLFAQQYQTQFERKNETSTEEKVLLEQTAKILGQVYVDARKNKLSEKTIKSLKIEHNEFIDYEIFKDVYHKMLSVK
ncbi:MAG: hypothetical protein RSA22_10760 [Acinetobacter sp.]